MGQRLAGEGQAYARVIASPTYFPLWLGQLLSSFQLTGQGLLVAGLVAAEVVPALILGPVAGVMVDRFSRKTVLIGADLFRAVLVVTLLWPQGAWHAYAVARDLRLATRFQPDRAGGHPGTDHGRTTPGGELRLARPSDLPGTDLTFAFEQG
jgi:hypothetical protein